MRVVYSWAIRYQPPWMTFVLALVELGLLLALAQRDRPDALASQEAVAFYAGAWLLAIFTKIVVLPNISLTYLESAGEFRSTEWSIPPSREATPIYGLGQAGAGAVTAAAATPEAIPEGTK